MKGKMHQNAFYALDFWDASVKKIILPKTLFKTILCNTISHLKQSILIRLTKCTHANKLLLSQHIRAFLIIAFFKNACKACLKVAFKNNADVWLMDLIVKSAHFLCDDDYCIIDSWDVWHVFPIR